MARSREGYLWTPSGTAGGLATEAAVSSSTNVGSSYDVVVIGSGFAGLIAARDLSRQTDLSVLLVEGRDRIGGRTWTAKMLGEEFEMGGTWVHWNQPHLYSELHRYDLHKNLKSSAGTFAPAKTYYKPASGPVEEVPGDKTNAIAEHVAAQFFNVNGMTSRDLMPYPHDPFREPAPWKQYDHLTVRQRLDQLDIPQWEKDIFESLISSFGSAPGTKTGFTEALRWYALGGHSMTQVFELAGIYKIGSGGMTSFARAILSDYQGHILLNTVIREIRQGHSGVTLLGSDGRQIKARAVISTIPLNCLGDVKFSPPLSQLRQEAIAHGHINQGAKIHFKLAETEPGWFATCNGYGDSPFVFAFSDHNGTKSSGPDGTYCIGFGYNGQLTDKRDSKHIVEQFKRNIRPAAELQAYLTHDWMNDPLAKGTWSCWGENAMGKYLTELQKPHGNVVFASADWADGWRGFVDGAIERGQKVARDVKKLLAGSTQSAIAKL